MYGMFGLLWLNALMLIVIVGLISILQTYLTLQSQNWEWWWRSFTTGLYAGGWMMLYSIYAMSHVFKMDIVASEVIYLLYMLVCSCMFGIICGTIALCTSLMFVTRIYEGGKIE